MIASRSRVVTVYFNPRAPRGARQASSLTVSSTSLFQSTRPARGATQFHHHPADKDLDFNPRAPRGARLPGPVHSRGIYHFNPRAPRGARLTNPRSGPASCAFQSTRPARGATAARSNAGHTPTYFNPRAPRGARPVMPSKLLFDPFISIHAPREGRDRGMPLGVEPSQQISIHAPREGRDWLTICWAVPLWTFQSTRPARGATSAFSGLKCSPVYFNPRAPRGARQQLHQHHRRLYHISIHAPREGRDAAPGGTARGHRHFNPRAPRGARLSGYADTVAIRAIFQSTRPARGATTVRLLASLAAVISIHAPREGRDLGFAIMFLAPPYFNPRAPRGARPADGSSGWRRRYYFNPRAPRGARLTIAC